MLRRRREPRELAGWQCLAGRSILRMQATEFAPLCATSKNTILRFESGEFMPRPETVLEIEKALRQRGIFPTFTKAGDPRGLILGWQAYQYAYPGRPLTRHKTKEEIAAHLRAYPPPLAAVRSWEGVEPESDLPLRMRMDPSPHDSAAHEKEEFHILRAPRRLRKSPQEDTGESPLMGDFDHESPQVPAAHGDKSVGRGDIAALEAEQQRLLRELTRLRREAVFEDE